MYVAVIQNTPHCVVIPITSRELSKPYLENVTNWECDARSRRVADSIRFARSESTQGLRTDMIPISHKSRRKLFFRLIYSVMLIWAARWLTAQQVPEPVEIAALPDAPQFQVVPSTKGAQQITPRKNCPPTPPPAGEPQQNASAGCALRFDFSHPLGRPPGTGTLTSRDKLRLAVSDVADPFNLITIGATAAIAIGSNPNTDYGPGMKGWAKNSGTLLTEDLTGAFFVTFSFPRSRGRIRAIIGCRMPQYADASQTQSCSRSGPKATRETICSIVDI